MVAGARPQLRRDESHAAAYVPDAEAFAQRLILAQLTDDDDGEGWWAT